MEIMSTAEEVNHMTDKPMTRIEALEERIARGEQALERNLGTITEQDWRDALERDRVRLAETLAA